MTNKGLFYILFAYFSLFTVGLIDNTRGPLYPYILEFYQIGQGSGALIFSLGSLASFLSALLSGRWLKRLGAITALKISALGMILTLLGMGVSTHYFGQTYASFLFFNLIFGSCMGVVGISINLLIGHFVSLAEQRKYYAGLHSMYGIASFIAPMGLELYLKLGHQWQSYFYYILAVPLVLFCWGSFLEPQGIVKTAVARSEAKKRDIVVVSFIISAYVASELLLSSRMVLIVRTVWGADQIEAMRYMMGFFISMLIGRGSLFAFHLPWESKYVMVLSLLCSILFVSLGIYWHPIGLSLTGLSMSVFFPTAMGWINQEFGQQAQTIMTRALTSMGGAMVLMHMGFGALSDLVGLTSSILLIPIALSFSFLCLVYLNSVLHLEKR